MMIFLGAVIGSFVGTFVCLFWLNYMEKGTTKSRVRIKVSSKEDLSRLLRYLQKTETIKEIGDEEIGRI